jgi:serine O-acetyltransferase
LARRQKELGSLQSKLLEILFAFNKPEEINANEISDQFFNALDGIKKDLEADANAMLAFDPAAKSLEEILFTYPGFQAVSAYRIANVLHKLKVPLVPRIITEWAHSEAGIDIHPGATIAVPFMIDHGTGVVIGETSVIGKNVKIYQGVTIGALAVNKDEAAVKRHPTIEDNVIVYANSTILGGNTVIGHDSLVGGNCFITQSIPPNSVVYHQPIITVKDKRNFTEPLNWVI